MLMIVPNQERTDGSQAVITLGLDGIDRKQWKKFRCAVCGGTVFRYKDNLLFELPVDTSEFHYDDDEEFKQAKALDSIQCTHPVYDPSKGYKKPCNTTYILLRGNFQVTHNG